jgi:hypothetical protein
MMTYSSSSISNNSSLISFMSGNITGLNEKGKFKDLATFANLLPVFSMPLDPTAVILRCLMGHSCLSASA